MYILGISAFYHDSAAALIKDGKIIAAAQEERFTRKKHDAGFPHHAVQYCLDFEGISLDELEAVAFYEKPLLKFERLLETYYAFAPRGISSFITSMPVWLKEKLFLKKLIHDQLKLCGEYDKRSLKLLFPEHHLSHAASAFYPSPFENSAILTIDGAGEWATASICKGEGKDISILKELKFQHSLGLLYSAFTYYLGFRVNSGEYKLMGLAPYGNPQKALKYEALIREKLIEIYEDGSVWLNQDYFSYATALKMTDEKRWEELFGFAVRKPESALEPYHCDLGLAIQHITEEIVLKMAREAKRLTGSDHICLAGGVALNCVANGKLDRENIFKNVYIQPAAGDAGGAPGAALAAYHIYFEKERSLDPGADGMQGTYIGPDFGHRDIEKMSKKMKAVYEHEASFDALADRVAGFLEEGKVVGWMQGRMEFGPRALGGRSILGDARNPEMQKKLNLKIKYRESFRPFAPSVLAEDCEEYFKGKGPYPYMLVVADVADKRKKNLPDNYQDMDIREKLYQLRSDIPAVTHIDFTARVQTVHKETNPRYHQLISAFKKKTGYGLIVNTSFNVRGEPIVCTPEDAYRCFMRTEMDYLVCGNFIFEKSVQPAFADQGNWKEDFVLD
jgi:carbamoyltransferase